MGFGPFRWVCTSQKKEDLMATDRIACKVIDNLMKDDGKQHLEWSTIRVKNRCRLADRISVDVIQTLIKRFKVKQIQDCARRASSMLQWDVSNGVARRSWSGNDKAIEAIRRTQRQNKDLRITLPVHADEMLLDGLF
uniref:HTH_48 domain-containing protein n=1 Tax=Heterorhabditis bacteriophora TaxID=37862 RepID=A0A1I7XRV8_HETBA